MLQGHDRYTIRELNADVGDVMHQQSGKEKKASVIVIF
jgi:hypothetical protein